LAILVQAGGDYSELMFLHITVTP